MWSLDRISREKGALAILTLVQRLSVCGVKVLSYQEIWTEAPGEIGELLYALTGWVARMESQCRSERTKAGLARVKANGRKLGRPLGSRDKIPDRMAILDSRLTALESWCDGDLLDAIGVCIWSAWRAADRSKEDATEAALRRKARLKRKA